MSGLALALASISVAVASGWLWFRRMNAVSIPRNLTGFQAAFAAAFALAVGAFANTPGVVGGVLAGAGALVGFLYLAISFTGYQSRHEAKVAVGKPLIDFTAPDADGQPFTLSSLPDGAILLKFFRGHW